jgi:hypothetical protein
VALDIEASPEYLTDVVEALYSKYLNRNADPFGLNVSLNFLAAGGSIENLAWLITGSPEFFQDAGGTNDGFVRLLYEDALGRQVDPTGESLADAALANGYTPAQVAEVIFTSQEYYTDLVQSFYQQLLHRPADPSGLNTFVNTLQTGSTDQQVIALILGSQEYSNNATSH